MLRLRTFGSPAVERDGVVPEGAATQRKPLALLTLLAAAGERGHSRDQLLAYLWPETGPDRAPHRLNQALHALRRDLAAERLFLGSVKLRLNPEIISSDLDDFQKAHAAGDMEGAVALYRGHFLDGFHLRNAPEFDRWMEAERSRLLRICNDALEALAASAAAAGDARAAALWWRRLADQDLYSSRVTVHLMHALAASGNRADALQVARSYQERMETELEAVPNPAVVALSENLRKQPAGPPPPPPASAVSIAVLPLALLGADPSLGHFAEGLIEEVMAALGRIEGVRVVARISVTGLLGMGLEARELGRRLDARAILEGSIRQAENRLRVNANLVNVPDGCRVWSGSFDGLVDDPFAAQERLAHDIIDGLRKALDALRSG